MSETTDGAAAAIAELVGAEIEYVSTAVLLTPTSAGMRLRRVDLAEDAEERMQELAEEFRDDLVERVPIDYDWDRRPEPHETVVVTREEVDDADAIVGGLNTIENSERLDLSQREANQAKLFLTDARFTKDGDELRAIFVRTGVKQEVVTTKKKTALVFSNGVYNVVDSNQLVLNDRWDAVILGDYVIGANLSKFENAFGFTKRIFAAAETAVATHFVKLRIVGFDELAEACKTHPGMARKAASIGRKMDTEPAYAAAMAMDPLLAFVDAHAAEVKIAVLDHPGGRMLVNDHEDRAGQWAILKLLDDDYLTSELTKAFYEAPSKSRPQG
jgi:hypothetical protein